MGRGLSSLQRRILAWVTENPPIDNGFRDYNWCRHPAFRGERGVASAPALSRALRRLEARGLIVRSWTGPLGSGHVRVELVHVASSGSHSCSVGTGAGAGA